MDQALVRSIVQYGDRYCQEMLGKYDPLQLLADWWSALDFFFGRACFQGRRDDISERVYQAVVVVLAPRFRRKDGTTIYQEEHSQRWQTVATELRQRIGKGKVGKSRDVDMVLSTLDFIGQLSSFNIVSYSIQRIREGEVDRHFDELQRIVQIGPKIASFYLRDVVSLYQLESEVPDEFAFCLQPVDVWVRKLVNKTGLADNEASDKEIREAIVALCKKHGYSPVRFNQGAWYMGYFAFDLLLETLMKASAASDSR